MKKAQLIGISVAGVAGLLAFFVMKGIVNKAPKVKTTKVEVNTTEVLVAKTDIGLGTIASDQNFGWQKWPKDAVKPGYITKARGEQTKRELSGAIARAPLLAGEPITARKLIKPGQGGVLAAILPGGMRAISTKIDQNTAVGGLILPNDHVDVILVRNKRGRSGRGDAVADTLFRNVRVLAIGQQIEVKEGKKTADQGGSTTTATLELTPRQSELLALANTMGEITLSLRSVADLNSEGKTLTGEDLRKDRGAVRVLRYGVQSNAYGVN